MENDKKEDDGDLDNMFAMMAVGEPPELGLAGDIQVPVAEVRETTVSHKRTFDLRESGGGTSTKGSGTVDRDRHRVRVDRAGRSLEDRKQMDDFIYQRLGFFKPLLFQENFIETLRSELQLRLGTMGDEMFSSAKVRLCGSWAAKLASRASDVNFTVLMQPSSLFAMLDVKKQEAQMKVDHPKLRPILAQIQVLHKRWEDCCDAIVKLEKTRNEAARDVTRDEVKVKFPEKWSLTGVQLEEFHQAASVRAIRLQDVERDLKAANAGKQEACQAIAAWEKSIPPDMEDLVDTHDKLMNAIANLSAKYRTDIGELTYRVAQETKRCGFEILEVQTAGPAPFAKLIHPNLRTIDNKPISVRIDVNNHHALFNARFLKTYATMDPRIESFLLFVRLWAGSRGVCSQQVECACPSLPNLPMAWLATIPRDPLNLQDSLGVHSHTILALHFLVASGYAPSILPAHGRISCPDHAYSGSSVGNFHDGVGYHFFKNREAPEKPADVFAAKRDNLSERSVRRKTDSPGDHPRSVSGDEEKEEPTDWESEAELADPGGVNEILPPEGSAKLKEAVQTKAGVDDGCVGDAPGHEKKDMPEYCKERSNGGSARPTGAVSTSGEQQLMCWSELLTIDVVLGYFRYYAHKGKGYAGRTFNHRCQVASLRPAVILPKSVWKGQAPEWRTSIEDAFKTYDARQPEDLADDLTPAAQSRLHDEWNRGVSCMEGGQEMDIRNLLQLMHIDRMEGIAYSLNIKHPPNGFYDTPAFKRIRSREIASTRRMRMNSAPPKNKNPSQQNSSANKEPGEQTPRGGQKLGVERKTPRHEHNGRKGKWKPRSATPKR